MTELKCPVCNTVLDKAFLTDKVRGCPKCRNMGNIGLWELLADTKKKLDIAINAMESARDTLIIDCVIRGIQAKEHESYITLRKALEQIKDNDKDVKC